MEGEWTQTGLRTIGPQGPSPLWHPRALQSLPPVPSYFLLDFIPQGSPPSFPPAGTRCALPPAYGVCVCVCVRVCECVLGGSSPPTPEPLTAHHLCCLPALLVASIERQSSPVTLNLNWPLCRVAAYRLFMAKLLFLSGKCGGGLGSLSLSSFSSPSGEREAVLPPSALTHICK